MSQQHDPWNELAMLDNDQMQRAIEANLPCCIEGLATLKCHDCQELASRLAAHDQRPLVKETLSSINP